MSDLVQIVREAIPGKRVLIIGDVVADQFLNGTITRISREAPVFILRHDETATLCGGAANAAVNIAALGGTPVLIGVVGSDRNGELLRESLTAAGVSCDQLVMAPGFHTNTKVRVLAGQHYAPRQQVIRIDYESQSPGDQHVLEQLKAGLIGAGERADAIIVSDYGYGTVSGELFETAREISLKRRIPLLVDSRHRLTEFKGATSATPNQEEVEQLLGVAVTPGGCIRLKEDLHLDSLIVTCGNKGMILVDGDRPPVQIPAVGSTVPVDVTGAGDTVIAAYALGLAAGLDFAGAAALANHAGGIVVMKKGTASVSPEELIRSLTANTAGSK
jgi:rfaE bifunctional protein kinase chain/domain